MPRYNVKNDKGQYACFSSIVDDFITEFMDLEEYEKWRDIAYGKNKGLLEHSNKMSIEECLFNISLNKNDKEICDSLRKVGLTGDNDENNYKIEIYQCNTIIDSISSKEIQYLVVFYKNNWESCYEHGNCSFDVYENERKLTIKELIKWGFL